jgi:hypothetical protein
VGRGKYLPTRLKHWVGKATYFYYGLLKTEEDTFVAECQEFHRYGKIKHLNNRIHPAKPPGSSLPICSELGCQGEMA